MHVGWTAEDVAAALEGVGLGAYKEAFIANEITGCVLPDVTEEHLRELGLTIGARIRFAHWVRDLECFSAMAQAADDGETAKVRCPCAHCGRMFIQATLAAHENSCWQRPGSWRIPQERAKAAPKSAGCVARKGRGRHRLAWKSSTYSGVFDSSKQRLARTPAGTYREWHDCHDVAVVKTDFRKQHEALRAFLRAEKARPRFAREPDE